GGLVGSWACWFLSCGVPCGLQGVGGNPRDSRPHSVMAGLLRLYEGLLAWGDVGEAVSLEPLGDLVGGGALAGEGCELLEEVAPGCQVVPGVLEHLEARGELAVEVVPADDELGAQIVGLLLGVL